MTQVNIGAGVPPCYKGGYASVARCRDGWQSRGGVPAFRGFLRNEGVPLTAGQPALSSRVVPSLAWRQDHEVNHVANN